MKEMVGGCCVCSDERGWPDNPLVYCDGNGCTVAVHQACYGIVTVPTGPWYCRKCESPETKGKVRCELCPSKSGALKRTDTGGWAHVVCALYIPEVRFGNVTSMEPIVLRLIPSERYNKTCYICQDMGKTHRATAGACMQCNKSGCKQQFHVTCAQGLGLLCEEAGNYLDNVKYCGYCQHHYSKLFTNHDVTIIAKKKGGNVKTIPPYKPVSHDSQSSDSNSEKDGEASPMASGSGTPTHTAKAKGPGRKSTHTSTVVSGKNTPNSSKTQASAAQPMGGKLHQSSDKKKQSPARRGSSTGDAGGSGSKSSTPAPSPQHSSETSQAQNGKASGGLTPAGASKVTPPAASPSSNKSEPVGVISSVASANATSVSTITTVPTSSAVSTSVLHIPLPKATYQESVITNTEAVDTKQTKKRKAVTAANNLNTPVDYATTAPSQGVLDGGSQSSSGWDNSHHMQSDVHMDAMDKYIKKPKTDAPETVAGPSHFSGLSAAPPAPPPAPVGPLVPPPPLPPPAHSPASHPSPRHHLNPMPGPSGMNQPTNLSSSSYMVERRGAVASLVVSLPLHSTFLGRERPPPVQLPAPQDLRGPSSHIYQYPKQHASMEPSMPGHSQHGGPPRSWHGIPYDIPADNKHGIPTSIMGGNKDMPPNVASASNAMGASGSMMATTSMATMPANIRTKKRAAMAASMSMSNQSSAIQTTTTQSLANVRRPPQPTPSPIYQETIKDSPPSSPSSERPLRPKMDPQMGPNCSAPHMLGNELNPESGAAACLQEQLSAELAAHAAGSAGIDPIIPPPLINKAAPGTSSSSGRSSSSAQSLDQLLERQWEQGSQFLMEQAQHFDIASLLSCLHQLRTENVRLEEHVSSLLQRRDHLLAVNARLAIPLTSEIDQSRSYIPSGMNCTVTSGQQEQVRCPRENGPQQRGPPMPPRTETITSERPHQLIMREVQQKPS